MNQKGVERNKRQGEVPPCLHLIRCVVYWSDTEQNLLDIYHRYHVALSTRLCRRQGPTSVNFLSRPLSPLNPLGFKWPVGVKALLNTYTSEKNIRADNRATKGWHHNPCVALVNVWQALNMLNTLSWTIQNYTNCQTFTTYSWPI